MTVTLHQHQKDDLEALRKFKTYALWHEVGSGKTYPLIFRIMDDILAQRKGMWVVVCEVYLLIQWKRELDKVLADLGVRTEIITGETEKWQRLAIQQRPPDVLVVNYEFFPKIAPWLKTNATFGLVRGIVCDEAHRLKGFRGMRSKHGTRARAIIEVAHANEEVLRFCASGSPVVNPNNSDVWGIYYFLDPRIFGPTLWKFEQEFFDNLSNNPQYKKLVLKPHMKEEMSRRMYLIARRLLKKELPITFPKEVHMSYPVTMPAKVARVYQQMEDQMIAEVEGKMVTRPMILGRIMALQQISTGFLLEKSAFPNDSAWLGFDTAEGDTPHGGEVLHIDSSHKDDALWGIMDEIGRDSCVIVWAHFRHELRHLAKQFANEGIKCAHMWGDIPKKQKDAELQEFLEGKRTALLAQPASAGAGLNLQIAGHSVRYSRSHRLLDFIQSEGRNHRAGTQFHDHVVRHEIFTVATKDEEIHDGLIDKRDVSSEITLDHKKEQRS